MASSGVSVAPWSWVLVALSVALVACGGMEHGGAPDSDAGAPAMGGGGAGATAGEPGQPQTGGGHAGTNGVGGVGDGFGGGGGGDAAEQPLLPLIPGRVSTFRFSPIDPAMPMTDTCASPTTSIASGDGLMIEGHSGVLYRTFCSEKPFLIEGERDDLTAYEINENAVVLPAFAYIRSPVEAGAMWDSGRGDHYTWSQALELQTAIGVLDDCWERIGTDTLMVYCRGVGLVHAEADYGNYVLDLVDTNF